jgi:hypothetical protein
VAIRISSDNLGFFTNDHMAINKKKGSSDNLGGFVDDDKATKKTKGFK